MGSACNIAGFNTGVSSLRGNYMANVDSTGRQVASSANWDMIVTAHELGHNVGSGHTFSSYSPPIDQCIDSATNAPVSRNSAQCVRGTVMSYCHLCGGIANVDMKFHARVIEKVKDNLTRGRCGLTLT